MTQPDRPKSGLRTAGIVLSIVGVLLAVCGVGYAVAYYVTQGFLDVEGASALADLKYGNLAIAGGGLCCGVPLLIAGVVMVIVAGRRGSAPGRTG